MSKRIWNHDRFKKGMHVDRRAGLVLVLLSSKNRQKKLGKWTGREKLFTTLYSFTGPLNNAVITEKLFFWGCVG